MEFKVEFLLAFLIVTIIQIQSYAYASTIKSGSAYCKNQTCKFVPNVLDFNKATAVGTFNDAIFSTGWGILDISAGNVPLEGQTDAEIMFAAGFLEGVLTAEQMEYQFINLYNAFFPTPVDKNLLKKLDQWFIKQRNWADNMIKSFPDDPFWRHASYIFLQLDGLLAGYLSTLSKSNVTLDLFAINFLNANGDLFDLLKVLRPSSIQDWRKFSQEEARNYFYSTGHCSVLIKLLPGFENLFMSHSSWFLYAATNRIYKHYNLNVSDSATASRKISFSSYPGYLESLDDFYHLGSGMAMLQTTNNIFDSSLYKYVSPLSLLAWQRVRIANMMAQSGKEWTDVVAKYNSGTYNNQYMVVDMKLIQLGQPLPDNTLWVAEQIPGLVVADDLTQILREGYFPSYNVPFFEEIFNKSGYPEYVKVHGTEFSYQLAPRAKIFRRDQSKVKSMKSMKAVMRSNDYKNDPYSGGSAWGAVCARGDLVEGAPSASGCYDTKVSDFQMALKFHADIVNGPTVDSGLSPFSWTGNFSFFSHVGLPLTYNFTFIRTKPRF